MATEKHRQLIYHFIAELPVSHRSMFQELAEFTLALGYIPHRTKTSQYALDFTKSSLKKTILKLETHLNSNQKNLPGIRLKFYANQDYSDIFRQGIQKVIEEFDGRYTGCYGCRKCKAKPEGYIYTYPDGKKVFLCGRDLIALEGFSSTDTDEVKRLLQGQDDFFTCSI